MTGNYAFWTHEEKREKEEKSLNADTLFSSLFLIFFFTRPRRSDRKRPYNAVLLNML